MWIALKILKPVTERQTLCGFTHLQNILEVDIIEVKCRMNDGYQGWEWCGGERLINGYEFIVRRKKFWFTIAH